MAGRSALSAGGCSGSLHRTCDCQDVRAAGMGLGCCREHGVRACWSTGNACSGHASAECASADREPGHSNTFNPWMNTSNHAGSLL